MQLQQPKISKHEDWENFQQSTIVLPRPCSSAATCWPGPTLVVVSFSSQQKHDHRGEGQQPEGRDCWDSHSVWQLSVGIPIIGQEEGLSGQKGLVTSQELRRAVFAMQPSANPRGFSVWVCGVAAMIPECHVFWTQPPCGLSLFFTAVSSPSSFTMKTNTLSTSVPNSYYPGNRVPTLSILTTFGSSWAFLLGMS